MNNELWRRNIKNIIDQFENNRTIQSKLNQIYETFCSLIFKEMDSYLQYNKGSKGIRKQLKCSKPFWNDELTCNWKIMRDKQEK